MIFGIWELEFAFPFIYYFFITTIPFFLFVSLYLSKNGILLPKLFWPTVRKKCPTDPDFFLRSLEQFNQAVKGQNNFW